ncbi:MAG: hypothetical protein NTW87_36170, partial [Planctomycetota bacterium]|nr:hypothetical protein [Planctomycetota bacterium]
MPPRDLKWLTPAIQKVQAEHRARVAACRPPNYFCSGVKASRIPNSQLAARGGELRRTADRQPIGSRRNEPPRSTR